MQLSDSRPARQFENRIQTRHPVVEFTPMETGVVPWSWSIILATAEEKQTIRRETKPSAESNRQRLICQFQENWQPILAYIQRFAG